jgi:hypothetical protein
MAEHKEVGRAGRAFLKATEQDAQSKEKFAELRDRFRIFGIVARKVAQTCEPDFKKIREEWESEYGPGYPETIDEMIREAARAGVDAKTLLGDEPDLHAIWAIIEGNRLKLKDESRAETGPIANGKPGRKKDSRIGDRNRRICELAKDHGITNDWSKLAKLANDDPQIQGLELDRPVNREVARKAVKPPKKRVIN